ncbi:hypothetical protein ACPOL_0027 [Acidisarcina polymorpha]|uniref:Uncharacterized protein n=1 Tax=Acidisarcina polymorpha TaxID=2211140 RepID=A0A2Z5FSG5_9BACT|nr:hypothetical protein [Acidisarcina polymorpha]AXC09414.1 hypothetical protein ACPOL_0027 [Acidisarcina polymorpha]
MNTSYPHHDTRSLQSLSSAVRPICAYCLHLLGSSPGPMSASMRLELEEHHECVEKTTAKRPAVSLPFN